MSEESYEERRKTCAKCIHDGDEIDISGSYCFLCKRNPEDHRIDWFEEKKAYQECDTKKIVHSAVWDPDRCEEGVFCPICDTWMDDYEGQPDKCPNCGVKLDGWNYIRDF